MGAAGTGVTRILKNVAICIHPRVLGAVSRGGLSASKGGLSRVEECARGRVCACAMISARPLPARSRLCQHPNTVRGSTERQQTAAARHPHGNAQARRLRCQKPCRILPPAMDQVVASRLDAWCCEEKKVWGVDGHPSDAIPEIITQDYKLS